MATGPVRMPPGTVVSITPNGANVIQEGPSTIMQPPGMVQYVGQQLGNPRLGHLQIPQMGLLEKLQKLETKTLGAIQTMMGLIHIGLYGISLYTSSYDPPSPGIVAYPIWGGAFFIISGSLSVSAENRLKIVLVKWSVGFNILSATIALVGTFLYWIQLTSIPNSFDNYSEQEASVGLCVLLLLFSTLEFGITVSTACLLLKLMNNHNEPAPVFMPYTVSGDPMASSVPPSYDTVVSSLK